MRFAWPFVRAKVYITDKFANGMYVSTRTFVFEKYLLSSEIPQKLSLKLYSFS